jgi:vacuolar-type H+-ATPase subunit C/Vma6
MEREDATVSIDFVNAKVRGMRSKLYESNRLLELADTRSLPELFRRIRPADTFPGHLDFERRLTADTVRELSALERFLAGAHDKLFRWLLVHFQLENVKIVLHAFIARDPPAAAEKLIVPTPPSLALDVDSLLQSPTLRRLVMVLPVKEFRSCLTKLLDTNEAPDADILEMTLDSAYLKILGRLASGMQGWTRELVGLDVDARNILLMLRARFNFNRDFAAIKPFIVLSGVRLTNYRAERIAAARGLPEALAVAAEVALPFAARANIATVQTLEDALALAQYHMASRCMAEAVLEEAAVFGYYYVKRAELANLIRLTESIRYGLARDEIKERLLLLSEK